MILLTYKALNGEAPSCLKDLIVQYFPNRALCSQTAGLLVSTVSKSRMGGRAFSYQALSCGTICQYMFGNQSPSSPLILGLKLSYLIKLRIRHGSCDPETSHSYAAISLDFWETSYDASDLVLPYSGRAVISFC